jgi:uroporphyrin-III C-methyltransferase/precorrin-2 dehydrogenase/sirohydrochlorin ferrochelatase
MRYLPIHLDTRHRNILIVGGEGAAEAKLRTLMKTEAKLLVIAEEISSEIQKWADEGRLELAQRDVTPEDIEGAGLVYAATEDPAMNAKISQAARAFGIFVNAADQKPDCDFFTPALVDRSPVTISIGTEGTSPGLARALKADLESKLPASTGPTALDIQKLRAQIAKTMPDLSERQRFWADIFSGTDLAAQLSLDGAELNKRVAEKLESRDGPSAGFVWLVGAGPGDPGLLTIEARRKLHSADVIVYDRLVSQEVLDLARREAEYIYVGKTPGVKSTRQEQINEILTEKASEGLRVVRLKSGDPLIFGRADEEIAALEQADISYAIVPGITSAASAAASIGMSLTSRGHNKAVALLTGHDAKGFAEHDWKGLAEPGGRAAIYMGVGASRFIQGRLLLHGADKSLPVTVVENASRPEEIILSTTLENLPQDIEARGITGPAILLLGYKSRQGKPATVQKSEAVQ